jgi:hypothetical protein
VRLAIYDGTASTVLWQSGVVPVTQPNAVVAATIASGTPTSLILPQGTYFLGFQTDSKQPLASYTAGNPGDGVDAPQPFGPFVNLTPANSLSTSNLYTEYINYAATPMAFVSFASFDNPGLVATPVTYTLTVTAARSYTVDFGDGSPIVNGTFTPNAPANVSHTYTIPGSYAVKASITDGATTLNASATEVVPSPSSNGYGVTNVSNGIMDVLNPATGLILGLHNSNGGVLQMGVALQNPTGMNWTASTHFNDIAANIDDVPGIRPVHAYVKHGIWVAKSTAYDATNTPFAAARKMLALSAKETGETLPPEAKGRGRAIGDPPSNAITTKGIKGKFVFSVASPDNVSYSGTFLLPPGLDTAQMHELSFGVGNIVVNTNLSPKGKTTVIDNSNFLKSMHLKFKVKKGAVTKGGETATLTATITSAGLVAAGFDTEGVTKQSPDVSAGGSTQRSIQVAVLLAGVAYESSAPVVFAIAKNNLFGTIQGRH